MHAAELRCAQALESFVIDDNPTQSLDALLQYYDESGGRRHIWKKPSAHSVVYLYVDKADCPS